MSKSFYLGSMRVFLGIWLLLASCQTGKKINWPPRSSQVTGSSFYKQAAGMKWAQRDSFVLKEVMAGNIPGFLSTFQPVTVRIFDSASKKEMRATFYVSSDYL